MSEKPTPETDALDVGILYCVPMTDHARRMERQRDDFRASIEQQANQVMAKAAKVAEDAIRQRDELAAALRKLINWMPRVVPADDPSAGEAVGRYGLGRGGEGARDGGCASGNGARGRDADQRGR